MRPGVQSRYKLIPGLVLAVMQSATLSAEAPESLAIGRTAAERDIARWDIDIGPDGAGLPEGAGNAADGEPVYLLKCASCHGADGRLGRDKLVGNGKYRTVGNHWPYATTLFDYIRRAMPAPEPTSIFSSPGAITSAAVCSS